MKLRESFSIGNQVDVLKSKWIFAFVIHIVDPVQVSTINFSRKRKCQQKVLKKSKLPSEQAYKTFIEAIKKHHPDAPYLEVVIDDEETSSTSETEHQKELHLPNLIELLRTKFSRILKYVWATDPLHPMLLDCSLST
ncbi:hypothetical protein TNIN_107161 [Trichonephila inaurata madagascariensis]|uniref:Uncharacterized protein n=1 Tax=Trichonephila inaurata madagascariensis TaxID=2747483 RepID=A0A8X6X028_9ARAC|nr:hypothetical protein TNIN_107161 [Trichonephila inaurata madagascariensis]